MHCVQPSVVLVVIVDIDYHLVRFMLPMSKIPMGLLTDIFTIDEYTRRDFAANAESKTIANRVEEMLQNELLEYYMDSSTSGVFVVPHNALMASWQWSGRVSLQSVIQNK